MDPSAPVTSMSAKRTVARIRRNQTQHGRATVDLPQPICVMDGWRTRLAPQRLGV